MTALPAPSNTLIESNCFAGHTAEETAHQLVNGMYGRSSNSKVRGARVVDNIEFRSKYTRKGNSLGIHVGVGGYKKISATDLGLA